MNEAPHTPTVRKSAIVSGLVSAIVAIVFLLVFGGNFNVQPTNRQPVSLQSGDAQAIASSSRTVQVVEQAKPSVVSIVVTKRIPQIERFFLEGPFGVRIPRKRIKGFQQQQVGFGSGFFVSKDGLIVTNKHVVSDTKASYSAITSQGETLDLKVVDRDPSMDIAVLKTKDSSNSYRPLRFGSSSQLKPGQKVIAIGNALGEFQNSVSVGVVSGLSRSIVAGGASGNPQRLEQVIQTDVAVNPGNSGGPLLNLSGEVVGVNVAIARGSENISFALPANLVQEVVSSVREYGEIVRPFLGVRFVPVTEKITDRRELSVEHGALVVSSGVKPAVMPGSPADKAGIRPGDVLLSIDGTTINEDNSLSALIRSKSVDQTVKITLMRDGKRQTVSATLKKAPRDTNQ